jgi:two-component system, response regulator
LIEDNDDECELMLRSRRLNGVGASVDVVGDGFEALDYLFARNQYGRRDANELPDLVLLDLKLPKIDGFEVLKRLRADSLTRRLPVVVLTSSDVRSDVALSYDLGANSYIRKPVSFSQFLEVIKNVGLYWLVRNEEPPH